MIRSLRATGHAVPRRQARGEGVRSALECVCAFFTVALVVLPQTAFAEDGRVDVRTEPVRAERSEAESRHVLGSEPDSTLERYRTPLEALNERMIGTASRSVRFDWRKSKLGLALLGSELLERNNFGSTRLGLLARRPFGGVMGELAVTRAFTWGTDSSDKLSRTPYRQYGRPSRFELDVNVAYPLAEGVVTAWPSFFPAAELVFSANAGFRYLFYPEALGGARFVEVASAVLAPRLTERELAQLEPVRPPGMLIDRARYGLLAGLALDVYLQPGAFISPRAMVAFPLLAPVTGTGLGLWWELTLGIGWAL